MTFSIRIIDYHYLPDFSTVHYGDCARLKRLLVQEKDLEGVTNVSAVLVEVPFHPNAVLRIRDFEETEEWREELTM